MFMYVTWRYSKARTKKIGGKVKKIFLHTTFFNKDFSLDIVQKALKIFTVILKSSMEGSVDVGLCYFLMLCRRKVNIILYNFLLFT